MLTANRAAMKERGRKMIVTVVKTTITFPYLLAERARSRVERASHSGKGCPEASMSMETGCFLMNMVP